MERDALLSQFADLEERREDVVAVVVVEEDLPHALPVAPRPLLRIQVQKPDYRLCSRPFLGEHATRGVPPLPPFPRGGGEVRSHSPFCLSRMEKVVSRAPTTRWSWPPAPPTPDDDDEEEEEDDEEEEGGACIPWMRWSSSASRDVVPS